MPVDNLNSPPHEANSAITGTFMVKDWDSNDDESVNAEPFPVEVQVVNVEDQGVGIGEGLLNILQNYPDDDDDEENTMVPRDVSGDNNDWMMEDQLLLSPNEDHIQIGVER